jgi:ABC-type branched-subunit amino acid transport system substrate-binding protein
MGDALQLLDRNLGGINGDGHLAWKRLLSVYQAGNDQRMRTLIAALETRKLGANENPDAFAALGYDAAYVLVDAIKRAGSTEGPKLRNALAATKNFSGVTGVTNIDANRDASKPAAIIAIKNGKLEFLKTVAP